MPPKPTSKPVSKASRRGVSVDSTSSQERMISESITHQLTGENGENTAEKEANGSQNEESDEEDEDGEVYEIEKILHHSKNMFDGGLTGYFVKWKGYPESENSWVNENDCNAPDLIAKYYTELKQKSAKSKGGKRGRASTNVVEDVDMKDGDEEDAEKPPPKRAKKETAVATSKAAKKKDNSRLSTSKSTGPLKFSSLNEAADKEEEIKYADPNDPQTKYDSMSKYWHIPDWSTVISEILTVDYASDSQTTIVYFMRMNDNTFAAATSDQMVERAPALAIAFFERNLRFREDTQPEKND